MSNEKEIRKKVSLYQQRVLCETVTKRIADNMNLKKGDVVEQIWNSERPNEFITRKIDTEPEEILIDKEE